MKFCVVVFLIILLAGCAQTSAVLTDDSVRYLPTNSIQLLMQLPSRPYTQIAVLEATGPVGTPMPQLLESMKKEGMALGADAVIPLEDASTEQGQGVIYNAWLGGYQTIGGGTVPIIRGVAIKYTD